MTTNFSATAAYIWSLADLLGDFKQSQYGRVILPFTILRRLECVLEATKPAVLAEVERLKTLKDLEPEARDIFLSKAAGESFYNTSPMDLSKLGSSDIKSNLTTYVDSFSPDVREIFEHFRFDEFIGKLQSANLLFKAVQKVATTDLSPDAISNHDMGLVFEELIRRFAESSNETAGEHFTPRDIVRLTTSLVFMEDDEALTQEGVIRTIYDPTAGTGGFLSSGMEYVHELNPNAVMRAFGQELNPESYAICKSDMLIKGQDVSRIKLGNTLSDDQLYADKFDYMLSNPPFGLNWKKVEATIKSEHTVKGFDGRFGPGLPRVSDGSLLFLLHLLSKMKPVSEGGSRVAFLSSGAALSTGDAGSGESEIRRHVFENDLLEALVALPTGAFPHTQIATYLWILSNRKSERRRGKVQVIDAQDWFQIVPGRGGKSRSLGPMQLADLVARYASFEVCENMRLFDAEDFGFRRLFIELSKVGDEGPSHETIDSEGVPGGALVSRDYLEEAVPIRQDPAHFLESEIFQRFPGARIDESRTRIGYRIDHIMHFGFGLERQLESLRKEYRSCELVPLRRLCVRIKREERGRARDRNPHAKESPSTASMAGLLVQTDAEMLLPDYLEMFFSTELGKELISELSKGTGLRMRSPLPRDLGRLVVPVPTISEQRDLLDAKSRIDQLSTALRNLESQLAANPENIETVLPTVTSALEELGRLPEADVVRGLVRSGESKRVEFKQTLCFDIRKRTKERYIEESALKTVVAFLNSDGGDLLIGVQDDGVITGIEDEVGKLFKGSVDRFLLHLKNRLKERVGAEHYPLLDQRVVRVSGRRLLRVQCRRSSRPAFLDGEDFYVRTNPATDKLTGQSQTDYVLERFSMAGPYRA